MLKTMNLRRKIFLVTTAALGSIVTYLLISRAPIFAGVFSIGWLLAIALMLWPTELRSRFAAPAAAPSTGREGIWLFAGLALVATILAWLEFRLGLYFTQDDNHSCYLPVWITAAQSFFKTGALPTWNGYQFLGSPTASLGLYALTYPFTYLSYAVAKYLLGQELWAVEVFGFAHFLVGYWLAAKALRRLGVRPVVAVAGALAFTLLGFNLIAGRSWFYMIPTVVYLPALAWSLAIFADDETSLSRRWIAGTACAIGLYFHSGSVQMWLYGVLFWGLGTVWIWTGGDRQWNRLRPAIAAGLFGIALCLPLLIVQAAETKGIPRPEWGGDIVAGLDSLILPTPLVKSPTPWGVRRHDDTGFYFSSGIFVLLFALQSALVLASLAAGKLTRRQLVPLGLCLAAAVTMVLAMGPDGGLWTLARFIPPFDKFRIPFRMLPFGTFFMIAAGSLMAERLASRFRNGAAITFVLAAVSVTTTLWSGTQNTISFFDFKERAYRPLAEGQQAWVANGLTDRGRVYPLGSWRSNDPSYSHALMQNYATFFRIPSARGYDTDSLEQHLPETAAARKLAATDLKTFLREFGVDRLTVFKAEGLRLTPAKDAVFRKLASATEETPELMSYYIRDPAATRPMAYLMPEPSAPLRYEIMGNGVDVETPNRSTSSVLIANFLHRHWLNAFTEKGKALLHMADPMGRIAVEVPPGTTRILIRYAPPWWQGMVAGGLLALVALFVLRYPALVASRRVN